MFDPERLLGQMLGGALGGSIGGRSRRRHGGGLGQVLSGGAKAQLGLGLLGVAMAAWEHYSAQRPGQPSAPPAAVPALGAQPSVPPPPPPPPPAAAATRALPVMDAPRQNALLLVRAMIAAAAADGAIDADERAAIVERARAAGDDADTVQYLHYELAAPLTIEQLVAQTPRSLAADAYAAALLAIDIDTEQERQWLQALAAGLQLPAEQVAQVHRELGLA